MRTPILALAALSLAVASPAMAQMATPASSQPEAGSITSATGAGGRSITAFDRKAQTRVGGYFDIEFNQPLNGKNSNFTQHRLILQASSYLHDNLFFNTEIEYEYGGLLNALTRDGELKIEQAWADYQISEAFNWRSGVMLIPFGIVNILHDSDVRETTARPLMASTIIPTTWMEAGTGFHGVLYPTEDMMLTYETYVTNGLNNQISPTNGLRNARPSLKADNNGNKALSGRLGISPWLGWEVGLSGYTAQYDAANSQRLSMVGLDNTLTLGPVEIVGEYANAVTQGGTFNASGAGTATVTTTGGSPVTVNTVTSTPTAIPGSMEGWYVEGRYRFFPEFLHNTFLGRGGGFDQATFTLVGRYGQADTNQAVFDASNKTEALIGFNYRPIQTFVTKVEWQRIAEPATGKNDDAILSSVAVGF